MADRHPSAYNAPVYPADPDCYHDRPSRWTPPLWFWIGLIVAAFVALAMGWAWL